MKKLIISTLLMAAFYFTGSAQVNPHAIGLRFGGGTYNGAEISYQHGLGKANRLELDLGVASNSNYSNLFLAGIYHWNWNITSGLNWYIGPGASVGMYDYNNNGFLNIGIGGQVGLEYDFKTLGAPILLSLDARPMFDLIGDAYGFGYGAALGIRYIW